MPLTITNTFVADTPIVASAVNQNFTDVTTWLNGANLTQANLAPFTGSISFTISGASNAIGITNSGSIGSISITQTAAWASGGYGIQIVDSAAQSNPYGDLYINTSHANHNIPTVYLKSGGILSDFIKCVNNTVTAFEVTKTGDVSCAGDADVGGDLGVTGDTTLSGSLDVTGNITSSGIIQLPPGIIFPYGGSSAPTGYLLCNGAAVSRTTYAALFAVISTAYGVGDGVNTFNLPDLRGAFLRGTGTSGVSAGTGPAIGAVQAQGTAVNGLATVDESAHTHTTTGNSRYRVIDYNVAGGIQTNYTGSPSGAGTQGTSVATGTGTAHHHGLTGDAETRPPSVGVNYIIKT